MRFIIRKKPSRFSFIGWGGPKTIGRSGLAKRLRKLKAEKQDFERRHAPAKMLSSLGRQRDELKSAIRSARRRKIYVKGS